MLVPYNDPFYYSRRPTLAVPAGQVLQIGTDSSQRRARPASAAHRPQADLRSGPPRARPAHRLREPEPLAFHGHRHLVHGQSEQLAGARLGRPLPRLAAVAGRSAGRLEHDARPAARAAGESRRACRRFRTRRSYAFTSPNTGAEATAERTTAIRITSHVPVDRPELAFVYGSAQAALATLDRVATVAQLRAVARRIRTPASARRCGPWPARWRRASARRCST